MTTYVICSISTGSALAYIEADGYVRDGDVVRLLNNDRLTAMLSLRTVMLSVKPEKGKQLMTVGEDTNRWFVTTVHEEVEDVGANTLEIEGGTLTFCDRRGKITFAYAPGTWKFVEYQD